ncbi:MAG TPA: hypothetical protein VE081_04030 [Sporichthyaceae bacterium]|nr:hypothetical protein [Sporichthyaceae bacterium]
MIVVVDGASGRVSLADADNLKALSVELRDCDAGSADLGDLGRVEGEHAWLDIARLRALSPLAGDAAWNAGFDATIDYAGSKGWTDASGTHVRAHLS